MILLLLSLSLSLSLLSLLYSYSGEPKAKTWLSRAHRDPSVAKSWSSSATSLLLWLLLWLLLLLVVVDISIIVFIALVGASLVSARRWCDARACPQLQRVHACMHLSSENEVGWRVKGECQHKKVRSSGKARQGIHTHIHIYIYIYIYIYIHT